MQDKHIYVMGSDGLAQEHVLLTRLGIGQCQWQQYFSKFRGKYFCDRLDRTGKPGVLCIWIEDIVCEVKAALDVVTAAIVAMGVPQSEVRGIFLFGASLAIAQEWLAQKPGEHSLWTPLIIVLKLSDYELLRAVDGLLCPDQDLGAIALSSPAKETEWLDLEAMVFEALEMAGPLGAVDLGTHHLLPTQYAWQYLHSIAARCPEVNGLVKLIQGLQAIQAHNHQLGLSSLLACLRHYGARSNGHNWLALLKDNPQSSRLAELPKLKAKRMAILLLLLGRLLGEQAQDDIPPGLPNQESLDYLQQSMTLWRHCQAWNWVAQLSWMSAILLMRNQEWSSLETLAWSLLQNAPEPQAPILLAQNYAIRAAIAYQQQQWQKSKTLSHTALSFFQSLPQSALTPQAAWAALTFARSSLQLGQANEAIAELESYLPKIRAHLKQLADHPNQTWGNYCRECYEGIFQALAHHHQTLKETMAAFDLGWELYEAQWQWGWHRFMPAHPLPRHSGAEILRISGRQQDIDRLKDYLVSPDSSLVLLHGPQAVGKTSLLQAGLIPTLEAQGIQALYLKQYGQWSAQLIKLLYQGRSFCPRFGSQTLDPLTHLDSQQDLTPMRVIICDQFESFFWQYPDPRERQAFFDFLGQALKLPQVRVLLACRNEALMPLMEWEGTDALGGQMANLFDQRVRYRLGKLSPQEAKAVLHHSAEEHLGPGLVKQVVENLQGEQGQISPRTLQVVGAQLMADQIFSKAAYNRLGKPSKLILQEHFLKQLIRHCGDDNRILAWRLLYAFTHRRQQALLLSKADILQLSTDFLGDRRAGEAKAELLLHIFKTTGLIRDQILGAQAAYQLARPDLINAIQHHYQSVQSKQWLRKIQVKQRELFWHRRWWKLSLGTICVIGCIGTALGVGLRWVERQQHQRWLMQQNTEIIRRSEAAWVLQKTEKPVSALYKAAEAATQLQHLRQKEKSIPAMTRLKVSLALEQSLTALAPPQTFRDISHRFLDSQFQPLGDRFIFQGQQPITDFEFVGDSFQILMDQGEALVLLDQAGRREPWGTGKEQSGELLAWQPQGYHLATAGEAIPTTIWRGETRTPYSLGKAGVTRLAWSPDGALLAVGHNNADVEIWAINGRRVQTLGEHQAPVTAVQFSPDGKLLATADGDRIVRIWQRRRDNSFFYVTQLPPSADDIQDIQFSHDTRFLGLNGAEVGLAVFPLTYVNNNPQFRDPLPKGQPGNPFNRIVFYGGQPLLLTQSLNHQLQFWQLDGTFVGELTGHQSPLQQVRWHPKGHAIATLDQKQKLILWNLDLDYLLTRACHYLRRNPEVTQERPVPGDHPLCAP